MRKRSQAYHAQTQEEYQQMMQEDDIAQKTTQNYTQIDKPGVVDQIEWLEQPDFLENDCKYQLELNTSSDSDSGSSRKKCIIIIDDILQLQEYFSQSFFPHLFSESNAHKILELVYSSAEEEMWIHFRHRKQNNGCANSSEKDYRNVNQSENEDYILTQAKNNLYSNIIEESFYPYADYIVLFSNEQALEIQEWKQQTRRSVKPTQKICIYDKQKHGFLMNKQFCQNEDSPQSEISWFQRNSNDDNNNKQDQYILQSSSPYSSSYSMIKTLINLA